VTQGSLDKERQQIIVRLKEIRGKYDECISDVSGEIAIRGSEWSIVDLLRHSTGGYYRTMLMQLLEEESPRVAGEFDINAYWRRVVDDILSDIDGVIDIVGKLTVSELAKSAQRGNKQINILQVLTLMADHYAEHLNQLINEVRPREGLPVKK
jgi:hypothetical protein